MVVLARPAQKKKKKSGQPSKPSTEVTRLGKALRYLGGIGGAALGSKFGYDPVVGMAAGTSLGASISQWLGSGDYIVSSNSIVNRVSASGQIPSMHKEGQTITVRHKEFITEVVGNQNFTVQAQFSINPGLSTTFPWLAGIASQYSEYRIKGMVYHYVPTSGNTATTDPALGSVMLQTSYRANEPAPTSKVEMLNEYWASESIPSQAFCHPIECDPKENPFNVQYLRSGAVPSGDSVLMYDLGKTTLAVSGQQLSGKVLGDLWLTYEIELRKPILTALNNTSIQTYAGSASANINTTNAFGTNFATTNSSFVVNPIVGTNTITFPPYSTGCYLIAVFYGGPTTAAAFQPFTVSGNGSSMLPSYGSAGGKRTVYTVGLQDPGMSLVVNITQPTTTTVVTFVASTLTGASGVNMLITEANPAIVM